MKSNATNKPVQKPESGDKSAETVETAESNGMAGSVEVSETAPKKRTRTKKV